MHRKIYAASILIFIVIISIFIMIIPTLFTKGISRVVLHKEINLPLILNNNKNINLIFFGYSGCSDICTPRLHTIDRFYKSLDVNTQEKMDVNFFDISTPNDKTLPNRFAKFFNSNFKGIYLSQDILRDYTRAFDVYFSKSLMDETEYDHTSNLYLLKKTDNKKVLRYIYIQLIHMISNR